MNPKEKKAVYLLAYTNKTQQEIAEEVGVSRQTLYIWRQKPEFQAELEKVLNEKTKMIKEDFKRDLDSVYDKVLDIALNSKDESTSLRAGQFILEQVLGKAPNSYDINTKQDITMNGGVDTKDILTVFEESDK